MTTYKDVMRWVAELDVTNAIQGFGKLKQDGKEALDEIADEAPKAEGRISSAFAGLGGKIGNGLVAGFGAIGVGAGMVSALQSSWEKAGGIRQIIGQFRLSATEAARFGQVAGELYGQGWGESLPQVQQVVATVNERLEDTTSATLGAISEQVLAVSQTWGKDYSEVIRSVTQLTQNGLAPTSQAALDLITTGFQNGGDEAGDLLDTINEYSQHWATMGLSGEDALNQIIAGFQGGQRDADKLADAVKEFRIRAVSDTAAVTAAYQDLGFDADETRLKFLAGGDSAREAFLDVLGALRDVEDPIEQNRLAVELIGTQYEDLGPTALEALTSVRGQLSETEGAAQALADTVGEVSPWDRLKRRAGTALTEIGDNFARLVQLDFGGANEVVADLIEQAEALEPAMEASAESAEYWGDRLKYASEEAEHHSGLLRDDFTKAQQAVEQSIDEARIATDEKARADAAAEAAARRHKEEIRHVKDAFGELKTEMSDRSAYLDAKDSFDDLETAIGNAEEAQRTFGSASKEAELALRDVERAQMDLTADVLAYEEEVGGLPDQVTTNILSLIDQGKLAEAQAALDGLERARQVNYQPVVFAPRTAGGNAFSHVGTRVGPGEHRQVLAGESFVPDVPGRIDSREDTRRAMQGGRSVQGGPLVSIGELHVGSRQDRDAVVEALAEAVWRAQFTVGRS